MTTSTPAFDPALYPRTYPPSSGNRVIWISFGALLVAGGTWVLWYSLVAGDELGPKGPEVIIPLSLILLLLGAYLIASMVYAKVILRVDSIEVHSLFSSKTMIRQEIMGRRFFFGSGTIELIPRQKSNKKLKVPLLTNPDAAFAYWFESIPDLNEAESSPKFPPLVR